MTIKEIIKLCNQMADLEVSESCFESDTLDKNAQKLVQCSNLALEKLYAVATALQSAEVVATHGFIDLSALNMDRVISLTYLGKNVPFRYDKRGLNVKDDGKYTLVFATKAPRLSWADEVVLPSPRISERIFAYGIIAEFFYSLSDFSSAKVWENRFENALHTIALKTSSMTLPVGRWV